MCRFIYRVTPFILHLLKLWHISHAFSNFHLHLSDRNLDNPSPGNIQIIEIRCKIEASSLEINRLIDYPRSKVSTKTVTSKFRCRISVVRSHANDRAALDAAWCKTEFDFHWSTRSVDSIPRKTVTATPRKIDFWLESNNRPPFTLRVGRVGFRLLDRKQNLYAAPVWFTFLWGILFSGGTKDYIICPHRFFIEQFLRIFIILLFYLTYRRSLVSRLFFSLIYNLSIAFLLLFSSSSIHK